MADIIGVDTGGPGSRRLGECGHTPEEYTKFKVVFDENMHILDFYENSLTGCCLINLFINRIFQDLVERMLTFDPRERIGPYAAVRHPFFLRRTDECGSMGSALVSHSRTLQQPVTMSSNVQVNTSRTVSCIIVCCSSTSSKKLLIVCLF